MCVCVGVSTAGRGEPRLLVWGWALTRVSNSTPEPSARVLGPGQHPHPATRNPPVFLHSPPLHLSGSPQCANSPLHLSWITHPLP